MLGDLRKVLAQCFERRLLWRREAAKAADEGGKGRVRRGGVLGSESTTAARKRESIWRVDDHAKIDVLAGSEGEERDGKLAKVELRNSLVSTARNLEERRATHLEDSSDSRRVIVRPELESLLALLHPVHDLLDRREFACRDGVPR